MTVKKNRRQALINWLDQKIDGVYDLDSLSSDASFRKYYVVARHTDPALTAVDAPPETEDNQLFVHLSDWLNRHGIRCSRVIAADIKQGFMLQEYLPQQHLFDRINQNNFQSLYHACFEPLAQLAKLNANVDFLPAYNDTMVRFELDIFRQWYLSQPSKLPLTEHQNDIFEQLVSHISKAFAEQPQVMVHRDFHSRNLMYDHAQKITLIDYQGAVIGPATYDLVSLLKDCYLTWPAHQVNRLAEQFRQQNYPNINAQQWQYWFDLTGLQRHIKCAGIFIRLAQRDGKTAYLKYLPSVEQYIIEVVSRYPELEAAKHLFNSLFGNTHEQTAD